MQQLDAIIEANLSDGDELNKLEEMLKSSKSGMFITLIVYSD